MKECNFFVMVIPLNEGMEFCCDGNEGMKWTKQLVLVKLQLNDSPD